MLYITMRERFKDSEVRIFKGIDDINIEDSADVVPYMAGLDHRKFKVKVVDEHGEEVFDSYTTEWCSCCGEEVDIPSFGMAFCPCCGELIIPCSMCDTDRVNCARCPYEEV